jgi:5-bromo-4-chloroindolyl phosphate hydrolysis protein
MFGSVLTGLGLAVASTASAFDPLSAAIYFVAGTVLHILAFGFDPLTNKSAEGVDTYQTDRVARAVEEAEKHLASMAAAAAMTRDRQLEARVAGFAGTARDLFRTVENDPRDLTSVRKYLGVYLLGARDATIKYAELHDRAPTDAARHDFMTLLDDLERNFASRTQKLLTNDKEDLDIEIGVLRDRLAREGVRDIE